MLFTSPISANLSRFSAAKHDENHYKKNIPMKPNRVIGLVFLLCCMLFSACHSGKSSDGQNSCNSTGEVKDFTGLDGCQLMIVMEDGKKLLPGSILVNDVTLEAGQKIRFDYRPIEMMSVCMAEDLIVEITCLEVLE